VGLVARSRGVPFTVDGEGFYVMKYAKDWKVIRKAHHTLVSAFDDIVETLGFRGKDAGDDYLTALATERAGIWQRLKGVEKGET
jgi:hypothetical protein